MKAAFHDSAALALITGLVAAVAAYLRPGERALIVDICVLVLGALVMLALVRVTRAASARRSPSAFERALETNAGRSERLPELARLEREVALAAATAFDLHYRLRPTLREIAQHRLASRHGIELDAEPELARKALGEVAWDVVRPDRDPPDDRLGPGPRLAELRAVVDALARI